MRHTRAGVLIRSSWLIIPCLRKPFGDPGWLAGDQDWQRWRWNWDCLSLLHSSPMLRKEAFGILRDGMIYLSGSCGMLKNLRLTLARVLITYLLGLRMILVTELNTHTCYCQWRRCYHLVVCTAHDLRCSNPALSSSERWQGWGTARLVQQCTELLLWLS